MSQQTITLSQTGRKLNAHKRSLLVAFHEVCHVAKECDASYFGILRVVT